MAVVVLDTDVSSFILKGRLPPSMREKLAGQTWAISFVTLGELTRWGHTQPPSPRRLAALAAFFAGVVELPYSRDVATTWGRLMAEAARRGRPRPANDTWIAAVCLARGLTSLFR